MSPYAQRAGAVRASASALPFLRRVYLLFFGGVVSATAGAMLSLYAGTPLRIATASGETLSVPPAVAFGVEHWIIMLLVYLGAFFGASFARRIPGLNLLALFGYTFITGLFLAPALWFAQMRASQGLTLDASPVRDAFLLTSCAFVGLSGYVLVTRKDFSFLGAALSMGMWVVLGALVLGMFLQSAVLHLAVASVGVLLFCGYVLYDTSRLLHADENERPDAIGAALTLFLDVVNLFVFLLRILSSSSRSR